MMNGISTVGLRDDIMQEIANTIRRTPMGTEAETGAYLQGLAACLDVLLRDERERTMLQIARRDWSMPRNNDDFFQIATPDELRMRLTHRTDAVATQRVEPKPPGTTITLQDSDGRTIVSGTVREVQRGVVEGFKRAMS